jgi:hypothetical protein
MIPTETLPLLQPLQSIPVIGQPLYDLLEPDLRILVNLGYGDIDHGWDQGPAYVPTPFGLFPTDLNPGDVLAALASGTQQGVHAFMHDLGSLSLPDVSEMFTANPLATFGSDAADSPLDSLTGFVNTVSDDVASLYAALLPVADVVNALTTTLPAYDASLFAQELSSGNLLDAVGLPIAANFALDTIAVGFAAAPVLDAFASVLGFPSLLDTF